MDLNELLGQEVATKINEISQEKGINFIVDNKENPSYIPKTRFDEVISSKNSYKTQASELASELDSLKKNAKDNEGLISKIEDMQNKYVEAENKLKENQLTNAVKMEAMKVKAKDIDIVSMLVDKSKLKLNDDGTISGLNEQFERLSTEKSFLFSNDEDAKPKTPIATGGANPSGLNQPQKTIHEQIEEAQKSGNTLMAIKLKNKLFFNKK